MNKKRKVTTKSVKQKEAAKRKATGRSKARLHYKDTIFRMIFNDRENLLSLYNAVNGTAYTEAENLEITTLENAVYMNYKNDVSFVFGFELMLYEHQSTVNPNMPLRNLTYVTTILQGLTSEDDLYGLKLVRMPSPRFVVFYNGTDPQPVKQVLRLSDAFLKKQEQPELELLVTVYNINWGYNQELMKACRLLEEYAQYVEQVRRFAGTMTFEEAVETAVDYCIRNDILADFLTKNRAEAIAVSIFEYDEEKHLRNEREEGIRLGIEQGIELKLFLLVCKKLAKGKTAVEIAETLEEPEDVINTLCEKAAVYAPEFDEKRIREDWRSRK
ncbi:MAG: transposase [Lachnospiraceae bacterium]|nr:transposase [Lachnospiraceae bacterium]